MEFKKIIYTLKHNRKIVELYKKYISTKVPLRIQFHDIDKVFLYLILSRETVHKLHRKYSKHHINNLHKNEIHIVEMVLDWESARYTKVDKPLNAYETCKKYYPKYIDIVSYILDKYNIPK